MSRNFQIASLLSMLVPAALILLPFTFPSSGRFDSSAIPWFLGFWLFLTTPQLAIILCATFISSVRNQFATPALLSLTALETAFCCGVTWQVPWYESGSTWILYFPLLLVLLAIIALRARYVNRWREALTNRFERCGTASSVDQGKGR
jgi:hypothetical protein